MSSGAPEVFGATQVRRLYWALVGGVLGIMAVFGSLLWLKAAPLPRSEGRSTIGVVIATVGTPLTGSLFPGAIAAAGLSLLATHSPGFFETRDAS